MTTVHRLGVAAPTARVGPRLLERAAGAILVVVAAMVVVWPTALLLLTVLGGGAAEGGAVSSADPVDTSIWSAFGPHLISCLLRSLVWAVACAVLGGLLAWPVARAFRGVGVGRIGVRAEGVAVSARALWFRGASPASVLSALSLAVPLAILVLPLAVPPWLLQSSVWLSTGPGTWVGDQLERLDLVASARPVLLASTLVLWSSAVAVAVLLVPPVPCDAGRRLRAVDGFGRLARLSAVWREDRGRLLLALGASVLFLLGETTVFDLAQVETMGFELRTMDALGAAPAEILGAATALLICELLVVLVAVIAVRASGRSRPVAQVVEVRGAPPNWIWAACLPGLLVTVLLVTTVSSTPRLGDFLPLHGASLRSTVSVVATASAAVSAIAVALALTRRATDPVVRLARGVAAASLVASAVVPGTLVATALALAFDRPSLGLLYDGPAILVIALVARTAVAAVLVSWVLGRASDPREQALVLLDGSTARARLRLSRIRLGEHALVAGVLAAALAMGELVVTGRLVPPGVRWLATDVLNAIHYQRSETVLLSLALLLGLGFAAAFTTAVALRPRRLRMSGGVALALALPLLPAAPGCTAGGSDDASGDRSGATVELALVGRGRAPGQFNAPRVVAFDPVAGTTFVIDKDARVQRFGPTGEPECEWRMPKSDRGKPTGASIAPDGTLVVADTHEHRVVGYSPEGELLWTLGGYGTDHGQFIYPTDIAFAPDGRIFVSEYGSNDRIQVFDRERAFLYAFGACGSGAGEFLRPQSIAYDAARDELYVADAGNHRIQVFTGDGELRRILGGPGASPGNFNYPFGIVLEIDGQPVDTRHSGQADGGVESARTLLVAEHSNHRIQRLDAETGEPLAMVTAVPVPRPGAPTLPAGVQYPASMQFPWALEPAGRTGEGVPRVALCDHGNSRIVFLGIPIVPLPGEAVGASMGREGAAQR